MTDTQKSSKKFSLGFNIRPLGFDSSQEADWLIILISASMLSLLVISFAIFIFVKIDKGEVFIIEKPVEERAKVLDLEMLESTVLYYQGKAIEFERIKSEGVSVVDPSL